MYSAAGQLTGDPASLKVEDFCTSSRWTTRNNKPWQLPGLIARRFPPQPVIKWKVTIHDKPFPGPETAFRRDRVRRVGIAGRVPVSYAFPDLSGIHVGTGDAHT